MERSVRQLSSDGAVDCGSALASDLNTSGALDVTACEVKAFRTGKPFKGFISFQTMSCKFERYLIGTSGGRVYRVYSFKDDIHPNDNVPCAVEEYNNPYIEDGWRVADRMPSQSSVPFHNSF